MKTYLLLCLLLHAASRAVMQEVDPETPGCDEEKNQLPNKNNSTSVPPSEKIELNEFDSLLPPPNDKRPLTLEQKIALIDFANKTKPEGDRATSSLNENVVPDENGDYFHYENSVLPTVGAGETGVTGSDAVVDKTANRPTHIRSYKLSPLEPTFKVRKTGAEKRVLLVDDTRITLIGLRLLPHATLSKHDRDLRPDKLPSPQKSLTLQKKFRNKPISQKDDISTYFKCTRKLPDNSGLRPCNHRESRMSPLEDTLKIMRFGRGFHWQRYYER